MCRTCGKRHNSYDMADPTTNGSHDVNLEAAVSIPFSLGLRSPGKTSPLRSRNLKEYEDQLEHLKKENFSLKLRIYFLEERISHKPIQQDKEELYNANVELKVETEALKKELCDKQELVRQAAALLTNQENKFKEQLEAQLQTQKRETQDLRRTIDSLQKEVDNKFRDGVTEEGVGDLTRLCGLAFSSAGEDDDIPLCNAPTRVPAGVTPSHLQGVFSLQDPSTYQNGELSDSQRESIPESASKRIKELETQVQGLTQKVHTLEEALVHKERMNQALNDDIENLKKEIEDREDKVNDLELEVNEKDLKVDQLMQELETRHLELEARDSTIQNLHDDLNKVEPQVEVKVQECMEKDRIIEAKKEQLQQQNKILVEIQITLDEKQKQISELEESLQCEILTVQKLQQDLNVSLKSTKDMAETITARDKEIINLKAQLRRKEKKVKDLIAELKEALDMLKKAKWEAETNGGQDGVKEMAEDENERLWAELEQEKLRLITVTAEKESFMKQSKAREEELQRQKEAAEEELRLLQEERRCKGLSERDKEELNALREKLRSRDAVQQSHDVLLGTLKEDLGKTKAELREKNEELWMVKKELSKRSFEMHDLIMKGYLGGSEEMKSLSKKLGESSFNRESPLEALRLFMEANKLKATPEQTLCKQSPTRCNSLSRLSQPTPQSPATGASNRPKSPKPTRSNSFSLLENALYANMGQKVCNTNQTFNTYVVSGEAKSKPSEVIVPLEEVAAVIPAEAQIVSAEVNASQSEAWVKNISSQELARRNPLSKMMSPATEIKVPAEREGIRTSPPLQNIRKGMRTSPPLQNISEGMRTSPPFESIKEGMRTSPPLENIREGMRTSPPSENIREGMRTSPPLENFKEGMRTSPPSENIREGTLKLLHAEVSKVRSETQALRKDREALSEKVAALQEANDRLTSEAAYPQQAYKAMAYQVDVLKQTIQEKGQVKLQQELDHKVIVSDFQQQVENLKAELKAVKRRITVQLLQTASAKYQESVKSYKQEITSLRKRLADSHNACDLLRTRLEELVDFLEQVLDMDRKGLINLSHLSADRRASIQKSLNDSRSLSHSLSHSLMIGAESVLGDNLSMNEEAASRFFLPLESLPEEVNLSQLEYNITDGSVSHLDPFAMDSTCDMMNQSFAAKMFSQIDNKTEEIDAVTTKLSQLNAVLESKDEQLRIQTDTVLNLRNEVANLREEIHAKDQLLKVVKAIPVAAESHHSDSDFPAPESPNDTRRSLHLSLLQQSLPSPTFDSRLHEGILTAPRESSSSDTLPPPPDRFSSHEERESPLSPTKRVLSDDVAENPTSSIIFRKLPRLSDLSFSRSNVAAANAVPLQYGPQGTVVEQPPQQQQNIALASPSESEAWSEPDRNVSLARIGLDACNLVSLSHDRSLSRSRMTKSAPFTSESDGEDKPEETKEGSIGFGTPSSCKPKRRSDAAEVKRLASKLRTMEQLNSTMRAELHIYQTLNEQYNVTSDEREKNIGAEAIASVNSSRDSVNDSVTEKETELYHKTVKTTHGDGSNTLPLPSSLLQEIRSLRIALEDAIAKYDHLKDQLEAALSGYLTEETRHLATQLSDVERELRNSQEKLADAAKSEEMLRNQVRESEGKAFELGERLAEYMTCNQKLERKLNELNEELTENKDKLMRSEEELKVVRATRKEREVKEVKHSQYIQMEMEIRSLKMEVNKLHQKEVKEVEKESKVEELKKYISNLEEVKSEYESRLSKQDADINELCRNIHKLQLESTKSSEVILKLKEDLQKNESRLLQVTKERFALVGEKARLQAQLVSLRTHANLLQEEVREASVSEEMSGAEPNYSDLLLRLKDARKTILELQRNKEQFQSEKIAMQKEIELMQEELSAVQAQLDRVSSIDAAATSKEIRELASLRMPYSKLKEQNSHLESTYKNLLAEKKNLEDALQEVRTKEKELSPLKRTLKEVTCSRDEARSRLDEERLLTRSLQLQIRDITSRASYKKSSEIQDFGHKSSAADMSPPPKSDRAQTTSRKINFISPQTDNKENRVHNYPHSRGTRSLPLIDDDTTSGESPDLGIGSDGQFSSLERLGGSGRVGQSLDAMRKGRKREHERMCSEPSHSQLISEIECLREDRESLSERLSATKESLDFALAQLTKANQRKEAVDKALDKQLIKTRDVLRKAKGNLKQHVKSKTGIQQDQDAG